MSKRSVIRETAQKLLQNKLTEYLKEKNLNINIPVYNMLPLNIEAPAINIYSSERSIQEATGLRRTTLFLTIAIIVGESTNWARFGDELDNFCDKILQNSKEFTDLFDDIVSDEVNSNISGQGEMPLYSLFHIYEITYKQRYGIVANNPIDQQMLENDLKDFNTIHTDIIHHKNKIEQTINLNN